MLIGPVASLISDNDIFINVTQNILFNYSDSINGSGSFASNNEFGILGREQLKKTDSGSGTIKKEMLIDSNLTAHIDIGDNDSIHLRTSVGVLANRIMDYAPRTMTIGSGYYVANPVHFNSRLCDMIQIKNYPSETSMIQEIKYETAINGSLKAITKSVDSIDEGDYGYGTFYSGWIYMNHSGKVTDGTTHIGVVHSDTHDRHWDKSAWSIANLDVDEVYSGTFGLETAMSLFWPVAESVEEDSWLPCCFEGWKAMPQLYQEAAGKDTKGIFDCTCYKGFTNV